MGLLLFFYGIIFAHGKILKKGDIPPQLIVYKQVAVSCLF